MRQNNLPRHLAILALAAAIVVVIVIFFVL
jgi:hypothetical protein